MIVYHGSTEIISQPLVSVGRPNLDFGQGFYVTKMKGQAVSWVLRPMNAGKAKYLNTYDFKIDDIDTKYNVLAFDGYNRRWLDFVVGNRRGEGLWKPYDIVTGGVANDRVFNTIELYANGLINADEALQRLKYYKPNNQICILKQEIIDNYLEFLKYEKL